MAHGARVLEIDGNFDLALQVARELADRFPVTLVNSVNPHRLQGQKTAAFEICDALGRAPTYHLTPVGNAGNISSHWIGYREYLDSGVIEETPRLYGFQAEGAAPIVLGHPIPDPETVATAIRIGNPASWRLAEDAAAESGGAILAVPDSDIMAAYAKVATEGVFCEPASAASVAGLLALAGRQGLERGSTAVCILTGHGLKDPDAAFGLTERPPSVTPSADAVAGELGL
jgi:threonine synthase